MTASDLSLIWNKPTVDRVAADYQVLFPEAVVSHWSIPSGDKRALVECGLPVIDDPNFLPNRDCCPIAVWIGAVTGYDLGLFKQLRVCLEKSTGNILGVPEHPEMDVVFINSSASRYVDAAWCYFWLHERLSGEKTSMETFDILDQFLDVIRARDPAVGDNPERFMWVGVVHAW